jgi:hypothetical protein
LPEVRLGLEAVLTIDGVEITNVKDLTVSLEKALPRLRVQRIVLCIPEFCFPGISITNENVFVARMQFALQALLGRMQSSDTFRVYLSLLGIISRHIPE